MKGEVDITKDYLVITRDENKKFKYFNWYSADKTTEEEISALITRWNAEQVKKYGKLSSELILDPLIREICAYREHARSFEGIVNKAKEVQATIEETENSIDEIIEKLGWCSRELCGLRCR